MVKIDLFFTAGYTETGGLQTFLERSLAATFEHAEFALERRFPAVLKPGPKFSLAEPVAGAGASGRQLEDEMVRVVERYGCDADLVLFVDDADCRWCAREADRDAWRSALERRIQRAAGKPVPLVTLMASPEVEAWFLADFDNGFATLSGQTRGGQPQPPPATVRDIQAAITTVTGRRAPAGTELFGCPAVNNACQRKLSAELQDTLLVPHGIRYSKRLHGARMLRQLTLGPLKRHLTRTFAPDWARLEHAIRALTPNAATRGQ